MIKPINKKMTDEEYSHSHEKPTNKKGMPKEVMEISKSFKF